MSASAYVATHFSDWPSLYYFPKIEDANFVLLEKHPRWGYQKYEAKAIKAMQADGCFKKIIDSEGLDLYRRRLSVDRYPGW